MRITMHEMDILMSFVLGKPKEFIYAHPTHRITQSQLTKFQRLMRRREQGEPIAYLTGHKEFYGLDFIVNRHVLIPRPDTETIIDTVLPQLKPADLICDVGTGSGNIAVTLKYHKPDCLVIATDISKFALLVAKKNAKKHHSNILFYTSDVLNNIPKKYHHTIDWLICNAPYLTKQQARKKSLRYEPQVALTSPTKTLSIIQKLLEQSEQFLAPHGHIVLEIGHLQAELIKKIVKQYYPAAKIKVIQDYAQLDRVVVIC